MTSEMTSAAQPTVATIADLDLRVTDITGTVTILYCPTNKVMGLRILECKQHPDAVPQRVKRLPDPMGITEQVVACIECAQEIDTHFQFIACEFESSMSWMVNDLIRARGLAFDILALHDWRERIRTRLSSPTEGSSDG